MQNANRGPGTNEALAARDETLPPGDSSGSHGAAPRKKLHREVPSCLSSFRGYESFPRKASNAACRVRVDSEQRGMGSPPQR